MVEDREENHLWETATIEDIAEKVGMGPFGSSIKVETFVTVFASLSLADSISMAIRVDDEPGHNLISCRLHSETSNHNVRTRGALHVVFTLCGNLGSVAFP